MTKIMIGPGEMLTIGFLDENGHEADGEFQVHFDTKEHPKSLLIKETAGLPGSVFGDAEAILYHEHFGDSPEQKDVIDATQPPPLSHT